MDITINELEQLMPDSYRLLDMRGDVEVGHGMIPGAIHMSKDAILEKYQGGLVKADEQAAQAREDLADKKLIIYCARGRISQELAEELRDRGYDAFSLKGGYPAWLLEQMKNQQADEVCAQVEKSIRKKFRKNIWCKFTKAINQYELVKEGDCIAVCISGGKDSMLMAKLFQELKLHNKFPFEVKFVVMDPGYSPENRKVIEENARKLKVPVHIFESDIFESVYHIEKSPCYLCARMRRGYLYNFAKELGCNKIALGHHYDDVIETILMGMLYGAQIQTMMPKLHSTNFEGMELIRPLYLIREDDIKAWRDYNDLRFIQCACKFTDTCTTCNNEENQSKRIEIKQLIAELKKKNPYVEAHIFKSVENVNIETVIAYKKDGVKHHFLDDYDLK
ncbi:ATPase [Anaerobutyricum soehngenii]|uniref:ATPase n=1 Tax=Anaerobutyricum soehngenii TaxID=105843 RepID=A0ABS3ZM79_9FIRM|nr:ATP-binding protein [Anaerobutyricum soehngenii]MBP0058422.1 ATPase [Anaerobutyricum soehngenii]